MNGVAADESGGYACRRASNVRNRPRGEQTLEITHEERFARACFPTDEKREDKVGVQSGAYMVEDSGLVGTEARLALAKERVGLGDDGKCEIVSDVLTGSQLGTGSAKSRQGIVLGLGSSSSTLRRTA